MYPDEVLTEIADHPLATPYIAACADAARQHRADLAVLPLSIRPGVAAAMAPCVLLRHSRAPITGSTPDWSRLSPLRELSRGARVRLSPVTGRITAPGGAAPKRDAALAALAASGLRLLSDEIDPRQGWGILYDTPAEIHIISCVIAPRLALADEREAAEIVSYLRGRGVPWADIAHVTGVSGTTARRRWSTTITATTT